MTFSRTMYCVYPTSFKANFWMTLAILMAMTINFTLFGDESGMDPLRVRQPNWMRRIVSTFSDGSPHRTIFYIPESLKRDIPIQEIWHFPTGEINQQTDLTVLPKDHPNAKRLKTTVVPHGMSVVYHRSGKVESISHYSQGLLDGVVERFDVNGKHRLTSHFQQGILTGETKWFNSHGALERVGSYQEGIPNGIWMTYHSNGSKASTQTYAQGLLDGEVIEWYPQGSIKAKRRFLNGLLHGTLDKPALQSFHEDGRLAESLDFRFGQPISRHVKYHPNGRESYVAIYRDGRRDGAEQWFGEDGVSLGGGMFVRGVPVGEHLRFRQVDVLQRRAVYDSQGQLVEPVVEYHSEGGKRSSYLLADGELQGDTTDWFPNGQVKRVYRYQAGKLDGVQNEYYSNGQRRRAATYRQGMNHGNFEEWTEAGRPLIYIQAANGKREGIAKEWHLQGPLKSEETYRNGLIEGPSRRWSESGVLIFEGHYRLGKPEGLVSEWYASGASKRTAQYARGVLEGDEKLFYEDGQPKSTIPYTGGELDGLATMWFSGGQIKQEGTYRAGVPVGVHRDYHETTGFLSHVVNYVDGEIHGEQRSFYLDGSNQTLVTYDHGLQQGPKVAWDVTGNIIQQLNYQQGKVEGRSIERKPSGEQVIANYHDNHLHGLYQIFYPENPGGGKVKAYEATYVVGKLEGEECEYDETGAKVMSVFHRNGVKEGIAARYNRDGQLVVATTFKAGLRDGPSYEYFPNGQMRSSVHYVADLKHGEELTYDEQGQKISCSGYRHGELHGLCQQWNADGILVFEAEYRDGKRHGKFVKYSDTGQTQVSHRYENDIHK